MTGPICVIPFSDEVGAKLDEYVATLIVPVYVIRSPERTGLIRARLKGQLCLVA